MMSKVVGLRGEEIKPRGEPRPEVVEAAEKLLALAVSGEVTGVCISMHHADECVSSLRQGDFSFRLIGLAQTLVHDMCREIGEQ